MVMLGRETVTAQGGYGALFAVPAGVCWAIRVSWYTYDKWEKVVMVAEGLKKGTAQCRGRICLGVRNLSWLQNCDWSSARVWVLRQLRTCLGSSSKCKKCDELINFIVRVSCCFILRILIPYS